MPCACRKNKAASVIMPPSTNAYMPVRRQFFKLRPKVSQASDSAFSTDSQYDFSATTLPDEGCNNCAMKHIGFASALV